MISTDTNKDTSSAGEGKKVYLETFGCQMNESDSSRMEALLSSINFTVTGEADSADLILLNTCTIREKAEQKVYSKLGRFKDLKESNDELIIGVGGCVAQQEGERLLKRLPYLDLVFGPHNIHKLPEMISKVELHRTRYTETSMTDEIAADEYAILAEPTSVTAYIDIMRGCNKYCTFCIVPYVRGKEVCRRSGDILKDARTLVSKGVKDITLLGQNVNAYGSRRSRSDMTFSELLLNVAAIDGLERLRFTTSHPSDLTEDQIEVFSKNRKICKHLHLPLQSGSDRVLKAMQRGYSREEYLHKIDTLKALYPEMRFSTDIIVGFPGESEEDFEDTMKLIEEVRFDLIYSFVYSPRTGTPAAEFKDALPRGTALKRLYRLQSLQDEISMKQRRKLVGTTQVVLVEGPGKLNNDLFRGRSEYNTVVNIEGRGLSEGDMITVEIDEALNNSLKGHVLEDVAATGEALCS